MTSKAASVFLWFVGLTALAIGIYTLVEVQKQKQKPGNPCTPGNPDNPSTPVVPEARWQTVYLALRTGDEKEIPAPLLYNNTGPYFAEEIVEEGDEEKEREAKLFMRVLSCEKTGTYYLYGKLMFRGLPPVPDIMEVTVKLLRISRMTQEEAPLEPIARAAGRGAKLSDPLYVDDLDPVSLANFACVFRADAGDQLILRIGRTAAGEEPWAYGLDLVFIPA